MPERVLVTAASRHGATEEIADAIAEVLRDAGLDVDRRPVDEVGSLDPYGAVVLGSALYMGRWLAPARRFAAERVDELEGRRVWLFSSGPLGNPPYPELDALKLAALAPGVRARDHRLFPGRLDRSLLSVTERAVVRVVGAEEGDAREWDAVRRWAAGIAAEIGDGA
jgi:menaquinone-dependent protoporphyrinogen oxidase